MLGGSMVFVITSLCVGTCDTACTTVCPVDCIHGPADPEDLAALPPEARAEAVRAIQLYIDPDSCIGCGACEPECPVEAIFEESEVPTEHADSIEANAQFFRS